jgi:LmbE family N-acetylglucosaminyl deacetylase
VVYTHHYGDLNIDHELTARATVTATRPLVNSGVRRVLAYETLSSTEWSIPSADTAFQPTSFVDIEATIETKLEALREYETELGDHPHPRTVENVRSNARLWGAKAGLEFAEPFVVLRSVTRQDDLPSEQ